MTEEITQQEIDQLQSFNSPWKLIKKALGSIVILLIIGSGVVINVILALVYIFGWFSGTSWLGYLFGIILLLIIFPVAYFFAAYWYGQSLVFWEVYREVVRPMSAKIFSGTLEKMLKEEQESGQEKTDSEIVTALENRSKHFVEKLPDFIRAYFQVFITGKDVVKIVKKQRQVGAEKGAVKKKAMKSMYEALDLQMSELTEPSMWVFGIIAIVNIIVIYFWMF